MLKAQWMPYRLLFNFEARTSRSTMTYKDTYLVRVFDSNSPEHAGIGECALFRGLSSDDTPDYEHVLSRACLNPNAALDSPYSSIRFGFETALANLENTDSASNRWLAGDYGIPTNGLVWMADKETMRSRIRDKIDRGFRVIKLKIGGISFDDEIDLLRYIRRTFSPSSLEIRLDANGAFTPVDALYRIDALSAFDIHSLEQPIRAGNPDEMARICSRSPIAIALDEELIGLRTVEESYRLLQYIRPAYVILKPSLCGGFKAADCYIDAARHLGIGWWATSALESNVGLAAIGRWLTDNYSIDMPQGLGTGMLYTNNIASPLHMHGDRLYYCPDKPWEQPDSTLWR